MINAYNERKYTYMSIKVRFIFISINSNILIIYKTPPEMTLV